MKKIIVLIVLFCQVSFFATLLAQEVKVNVTETEEIKEKKERVIKEEKDALKKDVIAINNRLNNGEISVEEADELKQKAADIRALNIENKIAIIDNSVALSQREGINIRTEDTQIHISTDPKLSISVFDGSESLVEIDMGKPKKYDKRTRSNLMVAFGLNNAIIEGQSIDHSPYKIGRSRFFNMGWTWTTRLAQESNKVRFRYGFEFQFKGLIPTDNKYFVQDGEWTNLEVFEGSLDKAKLRMDNLVFPVHFEFGPSEKKDRGSYIRYSTKKKFKFGIGSYVGFNMRTRQKLKYSLDGSKRKDKITQSYNTSNLIYGLSSYIGVGDFSFCVQYDLNDIFNEPNLKENNISLGLRFDL